MSGRTRPLTSVPGLLELARRQLGVVRRDQLAELGVTRHHVRRQIEAQRWQPFGSRLLVLMTGPVDKNQLLWSAVLHAGPASRLHGLTALEMQHLSGWERDSAHVLVPHGLKVPALPGVVVHHSRSELGDPVVREGLPCQPVARATAEAIDGMQSARSAAGVALAVVQQRLATPAQLVAALRPGGAHASAVRAALMQAADGADSLSEVDMTRLLALAGLTRVRRQFVVETPEGPRPFDIAAELADGSLLLVEVDGPHHLDPRQRDKDAAKDAAAVALGHHVLRIPSTLASTKPDEVAARFARIRRNAERRAAAW